MHTIKRKHIIWRIRKFEVQWESNQRPPSSTRRSHKQRTPKPIELLGTHDVVSSISRTIRSNLTWPEHRCQTLLIKFTGSYLPQSFVIIMCKLVGVLPLDSQSGTTIASRAPSHSLTLSLTHFLTELPSPHHLFCGFF